MADRVLIIQGHPDPSARHLLHVMAQAYADGARDAGRSVRHIEIAKLEFPLLRTQQDFESGIVPGGLTAAVEDLAWSQHIVLLFPLWLGTMPAIVKAFLEQTMRPHVAFEYASRGFPRKLLAGRTARLVVTMGMPALAYRWLYGAHGVRGLERSILNFVGISPVRRSLCGGVGTASEAKVGDWILDMRRLGASAR